MPPPDARRARKRASLARTFWRLRAVALVACCDEALFSFATGGALPLSEDARPLPRSFIEFQRLRELWRRRRRVEERRAARRLGDLRRRRGNVLCVLLWAPRIDSSGRRHTIVRSLGGLALGLGALACAAQLDSVALSLGAYVVLAATSATQAAAAALASDAYEKDARQQRALAVVGGARGAGTVVGTSYSVWKSTSELGSHVIEQMQLRKHVASMASGARLISTRGAPTGPDTRRHTQPARLRLAAALARVCFPSCVAGV